MVLSLLISSCGTPPSELCRNHETRLRNLRTLLKDVDGRSARILQRKIDSILSRCTTGEETGAPEPLPAMDPPEIDQTRPTSFANSTQFLYTGEDPVQTGVDSGTIEIRRAAVIRGRVLDRNGNPLDRVTVTVLNHSEYGRTLTREDGRFNLAVNGGGPLTVQFERDNYLPVHRSMDVSWGDFAHLSGDVVMIGLDENETRIDLSAPQEIQVHRGSIETDEDGSRRATMMFKPGTQAVLKNENGSTESLTSIAVRATEYTVGETGPETMPAKLPPASGYTYAVELSTDRTVDSPTASVVFDQPVPLYVDNFLSFPVGDDVPFGIYDRKQAKWIPQRNGTVVQVLSDTGGVARLDVDGDAEADTAAELEPMGVGKAERTRLAALYDPGDSLWRVPVKHFSPADLNWPLNPVAGAVQPLLSGLNYFFGWISNLTDNVCGSVIGVQNQTLGERLILPGTPLQLHYRTTRTAGYRPFYTLEIPLIEGEVPDPLKRVRLKITVAGRKHVREFDPEPDLSTTFEWNGKDAFGREVQGRRQATVRVGYVYNAYYGRSSSRERSFARRSGRTLTSNYARDEATLWQTMTKPLGTFRNRFLKMGGWSLNVHHTYEPSTRTLYRGDGTRRPASAIGPIVTTVAGNGSRGNTGDGGAALQAPLNKPNEIEVGPDGSIYIAGASKRVRKVTPTGIIRTVAGGGSLTGDSIPATEAKLGNPRDVVLGPEGNLHIADAGAKRIWKLDQQGTLHAVAGTGEAGYSGDGGEALEAEIGGARAVAVGPDGTVYFVAGNKFNSRLRQVTPDGYIDTVWKKQFLEDVEAGPEGNLYAAVRGWFLAFGSPIKAPQIRKIELGGRHVKLTGPSDAGFPDNGDLARRRRINPANIEVGSSGVIYFNHSSRANARALSDAFWKITSNGIVRKMGGSETGFSGDGGPPLNAKFHDVAGMEVGPGGALYVADRRNHRIRKIQRDFPGLGKDERIVVSEDGSRAFVFSRSGRHLRTIDPRTGTTLLSFSYNQAGLLVGLTDRDGRTTSIERNSEGQAVAVVSPFGVRTDLTIGTGGYLTALTNSANEAYRMTYGDSGMLTAITDPKGNETSFEYSQQGRLRREVDPAGGAKTFSRARNNGSIEVSLETAEGRTSRYQSKTRAAGDERRVNTDPGGFKTDRIRRPNATVTSRAPDGSTATSRRGPDPRFGMMAPINRQQTLKTPGGLEMNVTHARSVQSSPGLGVSRASDTVSLNGRSFRQTYDSAARTVTFTTPTGRSHTLHLSEDNRVSRVERPGLEPVQLTYNEEGKLNQIRRGSRTTTRQYNADGRVSQVAGPLGRTTKFEYDPVGRPLRQVLPGGREITYRYDDNGNLIALSPPGRNAHVFRYTSRDQREEYDPPMLPGGSTLTTWTYNLDKQLVSVQRPDLRSIDFTYDNAGRLSSMDYPSGRRSPTYDPNTGKVTVLSAEQGVDLNFTYDGPLPTATQWDGFDVAGEVAYTYNSNFQVTRRTISAGASSHEHTVSLRYNPGGKLTHIGQMSLSPHPETGLPERVSLRDFTTTWARNDFGEITSRRTNRSSTSLYSASYRRDTAGRIVQTTETVRGTRRTRTFQYDPAGRLIRVETNGETVVAYEYDANGNRLVRTGPEGRTEGIYDAQDRLTAYGDTSYEYNASGQLEAKEGPGGRTTYNYDVLGNLRSVTVKGDTGIEYLIDGRNRRVGKTVNGTFRRGFLYQGQLNPVAELDGEGHIESVFVYGHKSNVPAYMVKDGTTYRIISDYLGSVRLVVNTENGDVVQRMKYGAFGEVLVNTNPGFQPFGFAGGLYDHRTGLVRFGARDYDPRIGRWTSKDPILFSGGDPNLYGYVLGDPVNLVDVNGKAVLIASVVVGTTAGATVGGISGYSGALAQGATCEEALISGAIGAAGGGLAGAVGGFFSFGAFGGAILEASVGGVTNFSTQLTLRNENSDLNYLSIVGSALGGAMGGAFSGYLAKGLPLSAAQPNSIAVPIAQAYIGSAAGGPTVIIGGVGHGLGEYTGY